MPDPFADIRDHITHITFDCYGTLVDWETGIRTAIANIAGTDNPELFDAYLETEADVERHKFQPYRDVLAETLQRLADRFTFDLPDERRYALADTLPDWPIWPDTNDALTRLKSRYKLGVLSNIVRDLFAGTCQHLSVDFDLLITAEDVRNYKPSHHHFERMLTDTGGDNSRILHVAQSLYHDHVPAGQLGIRSVWINRRNESNQTNATPMHEFPDLKQFADALLDG